MKTIEIPIQKIDQSENTRMAYSDADMHELMHSMKHNGLLQPIGVYLAGDRYETVFGNRRLAAARKLGWKFIAAQVFNDLNDTEILLSRISENTHRANLTTTEEANAYQGLINEGMKPSEIAARLGVGKARIETALGISRLLPKEYVDMVSHSAPGEPAKKGKISTGNAHFILTTAKHHRLDANDTKKLFNAVLSGTKTEHLRAIIPGLRSGATAEQALRRAEKLKHVNLRFFISKSQFRQFTNTAELNAYFIGLIKKYSKVKIAAARAGSRKSMRQAGMKKGKQFETTQKGSLAQ